MEINEPERRLLRPGEASARLGVSTTTLRRLAADGSIRRVKVRDALRYPSEDIEAYIERQGAASRA